MRADPARSTTIFLQAVFAAIFILTWLPISAGASPWAEAGDPQLRSDIEILANAGVLDNITTHWPLPWRDIVARLQDSDSLSHQPDFVREAGRRVLGQARTQTQTTTWRLSATAGGTNLPSVVRGFDALGRGDFDGQIALEHNWDSTSVRLAAGAQVDYSTGKVHFLPDNSYIAQRVGNAVLYGGTLSHWWGPGWISALSLSNNARPFPQVGIARLDTSPFETPWLSWLGPWQAEFFVGWLNDDRMVDDTLYDGLRFTFNPLPGLEIGLARTQEVCGNHHRCDPIVDYFHFANDPGDVNNTNDEGVFDIRYTNVLGGVPFEVYTQLMNEDSSPIDHSGTSHLFGGSIWVPVGGNPVRLTFEYTDSVATADIFSFGDYFHGFAYNNWDYVDGMRYRGRTIGFSLDSDSRLFSAQASWIDGGDRTYTLTFHHAQISTAQNFAGNAVTTTPVKINMGVARVTMPLRTMKLDLEGRVQSDQLRPKHGFAASVEARVRVGL
jgi:hypothetical protein